MPAEVIECVYCPHCESYDRIDIEKGSTSAYCESCESDFDVARPAPVVHLVQLTCLDSTGRAVHLDLRQVASLPKGAAR
jgi:transposase-like protein